MVDNSCRVFVLEPESSVWSTIEKVTANARQEHAFFVLDVGDIVKKYELWKSVMPRIHPHYAVKCNNHSIILRTLAALGAGFDVASKGEIELMSKLGVETDRMIFSNPFKGPSHFQYAADIGLNTLTFDSACELHKAKDIYPDAKYVIRIKCDSLSWNIRLQFGCKFGCDHQTEAPKLLDLARNLKLDVVGVSFHVGTEVKLDGIYIYEKAIKASKHVFDYAASIGYNFKLLDIGGGFEHDEDIPKVAEVINAALDEYFPDPSIRVIAEPGRYFVASVMTLCCSIIATKTTQQRTPYTGGTYDEYMYIINDGIYGSFRDQVTKPRVLVPKVLSKSPNIFGNYPSSIWGPTCDPRDKIAEKILLPKANYLDWLIFENFGDYSIPVSSYFQEFPPPSVLAVCDHKTWKMLKDNDLFKNIFTFDAPEVEQKI